MKDMFQMQHNKICICQSWGKCLNSQGWIEFPHLERLWIPPAALHTKIGCLGLLWVRWVADLQPVRSCFSRQARTPLLEPSPWGLRSALGLRKHPDLAMWNAVLLSCCFARKLFALLPQGSNWITPKFHFSTSLLLLGMSAEIHREI